MAAAVSWLTAAGQAAELARIVVAMVPYWNERGQRAQRSRPSRIGGDLTDLSIADYAKVCAAAGRFYAESDYRRSVELAGQALEAFISIGDIEGEAAGPIAELHAVEVFRGDIAVARDHYQRALALSSAIGRPVRAGDGAAGPEPSELGRKFRKHASG